MGTPRDNKSVSDLTAIKPASTNNVRGGSTLQMMLDMAKNLHKNGHVLFNSNPVLRREAELDSKAAKLLNTINIDLPKVERDREIGELAIRKLREASTLEHVNDVEKLTTRFAAADKDASVYTNQTMSVEKDLKNFIQLLPKTVDMMIEAVMTEGKSVPYGAYLEELQAQKVLLTKITSSVTMLMNAGNSVSQSLKLSFDEVKQFAQSKPALAKAFSGISLNTTAPSNDDNLRME
jgi:hypothetical protein